jgi:hypothetical protein
MLIAVVVAEAIKIGFDKDGQTLTPSSVPQPSSFVAPGAALLA